MFIRFLLLNISLILHFAQEALNNLEDYDKTCLESALQGVSNIVQQEWGYTCPCQVLCSVFCHAQA